MQPRKDREARCRPGRPGPPEPNLAFAPFSRPRPRLPRDSAGRDQRWVADDWMCVDTCRPAAAAAPEGEIQDGSGCIKDQFDSLSLSALALNPAQGSSVLELRDAGLDLDSTGAIDQLPFRLHGRAPQWLENQPEQSLLRGARISTPRRQVPLPTSAPLLSIRPISHRVVLPARPFGGYRVRSGPGSVHARAFWINCRGDGLIQGQTRR
ncbi:hypothetical protein CDD83_6164 [Cordyceps sp. RAO-2017]|nr:hypothetical protein CDD83_6164 [Cordyceps sp. RAO-2017]